MNLKLRKRAALASLFFRAVVKGDINLLSQSSSFGFLSSEEIGQLRVDFSNWVYMCTTRIAESVAATPLRLWKAKGPDRRDWEELHTHPLLDLLDNPNPDMDRAFFLQYLSMHDDLYGKSFSLLVGVKNETAEPEMLYPIDPLRVKIKNGKKIPALIQSFAYTNEGEENDLSPYEVMYLRRPNPRDIIGGFGPAQGIKSAIVEDTQARLWMSKLYKNSAIPGILLKSDTNDSETNRMLRESFEDRHSGVENAYRTGVLPPGVDVAKEGTSNQDMQFLETRRWTRDETLAGFGMPAPLLGLGLGETVNRASMETLEYIFAKYTLNPKLKRMEACFNKNLTPRFGPGLFLEFDNPIPENVESEIRRAEASLGRAPWASVNDVRAAMGLEPITGGDQVMGSALMQPIGSTSGEKRVHAYIRRAMNNADVIDQKQTALAKLVTSLVVKRNKAESIKQKQLTKDAVDWEPQWDAFVKRVVPHEKDFQKKMAIYAKGMGERAEANLDRAVKGMQSKAVDPRDLLDVNEEVAAIIKLTGPVYDAILKEEGKAAADLIGEAFDAADATLQESLDKSISLMAEKYSQETMDLLKQKLEEGLAEDENMDQLRDRVATIEEFSATTRAARVANTEAFRTANFATRSAWRQSGVVSSIKWYTAKDEQVCEFCGPQDGLVVGIDENFYDKGDEVDGDGESKLPLNYADVENPPLHPNCRCYIRPEDISVTE